MRLFIRSLTALAFVFTAAPALAKLPDTPDCAAAFPPKPVVATHQLPSYPQLSIRLGEEGTTRMFVMIGEKGVPVDVKLSDSSGSARLDQAAMEHVGRTWLWEPLAESCRQPVKVMVQVIWKLKDAPDSNGAFGELGGANIMALTSVLVMDEADIPPGVKLDRPIFTIVLAIVSESGEMNIAMTRSSGDAALDARAQELVKARYRWQPARMNGKPVGSGAILAMFWMPPGTPRLDPQALKTLMGAFVKSADKPAP